MNKWVHVATVAISAFAAACGGGGGGDNRDTSDPVGGGPTTPPTMPSPTPPVTQSSVDFQGLYAASAADPDDPSGTVFTQVLITPDGKALAYVLEDPSDPAESPTVAVIEGRLVASGSDAVLADATAFITETPPTSASGRFTIDTDPSTDADLHVELMVAGNTMSFELESFPTQYRKPSSLESIAGNYGEGIDTDSTLMVDSAGNVIVTQDAATGCSGTGRVTVDMPNVNAYAFSLQLAGCADSDQNGTYRGRLSLVDLEDGTVLMVLFANSDTLPLFDPLFEKI